MEKIIVKDLLNRNSAISQGKAILLREYILKVLSEKRREVIVDFSDINNYTILFFNFSLSYLICKYGVEWFDKMIHVEGLSELGHHFYNISRTNAITKIKEWGRKW